MGNVRELKEFTRGQLDAALMKIGDGVGMGTAEGIKAFLNDKLNIIQPETEITNKSKDVNGFARILSVSYRTKKNGIIYLTIMRNNFHGMIGRKWIRLLEKKGYDIDEDAKKTLVLNSFQRVFGRKIEIAILKGERLRDDCLRTTGAALNNGKHCGFYTPRAEIACLIRAALTTEEIRNLGLNKILVIHNPCMDSYMDSRSHEALSVSNHFSSNKGRLESYPFIRNNNLWSVDTGFAFEVDSPFQAAKL